MERERNGRAGVSCSLTYMLLHSSAVLVSMAPLYMHCGIRAKVRNLCYWETRMTCVTRPAMIVA